MEFDLGFYATCYDVILSAAVGKNRGKNNAK